MKKQELKKNLCLPSCPISNPRVFFAQKGNKKKSFCMIHLLRGPWGNLTLLEFKKHMLPIYMATGDQAHTIKYRLLKKKYKAMVFKLGRYPGNGQEKS